MNIIGNVILYFGGIISAGMHLSVHSKVAPVAISTTVKQQQAVLPSQKKQTEQNQLQKIFHHKRDHAREVELGSIVFYFAEKPLVHNLSRQDKKDDQMELVLFFPKVFAHGDEVKSIMRNAAKLQHDLYAVRFESSKTPTDGIKVFIAYNPSKVDMRYNLFDFVAGQKQSGIRFQFFNQELLRALGDEHGKQQVLNMACAKKGGDIIIDCGHGGTDVGTTGCFGLQEKDITLAIGRTVADLLKKKGFTVIMTRSDDLFVPLDERTTMANYDPHAHLFISIHANHASNKNVTGVETYYCEPELFKQAFNTMSPAHKKIVLEQEGWRAERSKLLANLTHEHLIQEAHKQNPLIVDRKVHQTISQVLLGTAMPAALIEIGFLSNEHEASLLRDKDYQYLVAHGISQGIVSYINTVMA